jgi:hypothetical protein
LNRHQQQPQQQQQKQQKKQQQQPDQQSDARESKKDDSSSTSTSSSLQKKTLDTLASASQSVASTLSSFIKLPTVVTDYVQPPRDWATATLKDPLYPFICGFSTNDILFVATKSGYLYKYQVPQTGGTCKLLSEHSLQDHASEALGVEFHNQR